MLEARERRFTADVGFRCRTPEETGLLQVCEPADGVITHVEAVAERNHELRPVYSAGFFVKWVGRTGADPRERCGGLPGEGADGGAGADGAMCEAIERYSAAYQGDEAVVRGRIGELGVAIGPGFLHFSEAQYRVGG
ncbi:MAG: hypothetical protein R3B70_09940 [Polyangiaceae bacterium]